MITNPHLIIDVLGIYSLPNFYEFEETTIKASILCKLVNVFIIHIRKYVSTENFSCQQPLSSRPTVTIGHPMTSP